MPANPPPTDWATCWPVGTWTFTAAVGTTDCSPAPTPAAQYVMKGVTEPDQNGDPQPVMQFTADDGLRSIAKYSRRRLGPVRGRARYLQRRRQDRVAAQARAQRRQLAHGRRRVRRVLDGSISALSHEEAARHRIGRAARAAGTDLVPAPRTGRGRACARREDRARPRRRSRRAHREAGSPRSRRRSPRRRPSRRKSIPRATRSSTRSMIARRASRRSTQRPATRAASTACIATRSSSCSPTSS